MLGVASTGALLITGIGCIEITCICFLANTCKQLAGFGRILVCIHEITGHFYVLFLPMLGMDVLLITGIGLIGITCICFQLILASNWSFIISILANARNDM